MRRLPAATLAVTVLVLGLVVGSATAASPNDTACRKVVSGSVSHSELLDYDACRFDKLDAAVKALTPTATPDPSTSPTSTPTPTARSDAAGAVLFEDDFGGTGSYDHKKWGEWSSDTYNGSAAYGNIKPGDRAELDGDGHLSVPATPTQGTSISTKDDFTFLYGTVTARMKVPTAAGYLPAFWTLNNNSNGVDALPLGEADIHESYTGLANYYHRGTHNWNNDLTWGSPGDPACGRDHVFGEWHDYSAKFEPNQVTFYFDGVQCGAVATKADGGGKPYGFGPDVTRGNWLLLTLAVGGAGGQQDGKAKAPAQLLVDFVKVTANGSTGDPSSTRSASASPTVSPSPTSKPSPTSSPSPTAAASTCGTATTSPKCAETWKGADGAPWAGWTTWRNATVQAGRGRLALTSSQNYTSSYWTAQAPVTDFDLTTSVDAGITNGAVRVGVAGAATNDNEPRDGQTVKFGISGGKVTELALRSSKAGSGSEVAYAPIGGNAVTPSSSGLQVRVQRKGATVQAKVWPAGTAQPTAWAISGTDANPPTLSGRVFLSAVTGNPGHVDFDDLTVT